MRTLPHTLAVLATASALLASAPEARPDAADRAARIESGLPAVTRGDRTLRLSLAQWMDTLGVPGLGIAVIDGHRLAWAKGYGVTTPGPGGTAVTPATLFQAASISKPVAALAVLHQVERGTFALDADINDYLRSWRLPPGESPAGDTVTIRHLLAHTAGITPGGFAGYDRTAPRPGIVQVLGGMSPASNSPARVVAKPGSEVRYSGLGYTLLQLALEDRLGKPFESILRETVLEPLRLANSTFEQDLPGTLESRAARGHRNSGDPIAGGWLANPELAAAGLWSTPTDLATLLIEVAASKRGRGNRVLSSGMTRRMLTPHRDGMGLGFVVRDGDAHGYFAHSGGNPGYFAHVEMLADSGKGIAVMTNSDNGRLLASLVIAAVATEYAWPLPDRRQVSADRTAQLFAELDRVTTRRVRVEVSPAVLARYVGSYELAPGLRFEVTLDGDRLHVRLGDQPRFPLFPESESKFFLEAVDAQLTFVVDATSRATALVLHQGGRDQRAPRVD